VLAAEQDEQVICDRFIWEEKLAESINHIQIQMAIYN
jgi:hypothetical protein